MGKVQSGTMSTTRLTSMKDNGTKVNLTGLVSRLVLLPAQGISMFTPFFDLLGEWYHEIPRVQTESYDGEWRFGKKDGKVSCQIGDAMVNRIYSNDIKVFEKDFKVESSWEFDCEAE